MPCWLNGSRRGEDEIGSDARTGANAMMQCYQPENILVRVWPSSLEYLAINSPIHLKQR